MTRRSMMNTVMMSAIAVVACAPLAAMSPNCLTRKPGRYFHRFNRPSDSWVPIEFEDIRAGMEIWTEDFYAPNDVCSTVVLVSCGPDQCREADEFMASARIDPKTNQWVYKRGV